jgi:hypothetical protein
MSSGDTFRSTNVMNKPMKEKEKIDKDDKLKPLIFAFILIAIVWVLSYFIVKHFIPAENDRGTFGDTFGAINSLFSGLALAGIIYTILLQRKELSLQRLELIETRRELKRSADVQEKSEKALTDQIKSMKLTAKLNALNSLVDNFGKEEDVYRKIDLNKSNVAKRQKEMFLTEIKNTLKDLEKQ